MKTFYLNRNLDISGVSGTGIIAEGVEFSDGKCVLRFLTKSRSIAIYDSMFDLVAIHGHGGSTEISWEKIWPAAATS